MEDRGNKKSETEYSDVNLVNSESLIKKIEELQSENKKLREKLNAFSGNPKTNDKKQGHSSGIKFSMFQSDFFQQVPFLMWAKDKKGRFIWVNEEFGKAFNSSPELIKGKTDYDICTKEFAEKYRKDDHKVLSSAKELIFEELIPSEEGDIWYETFKTPLFDEKGKVIGVAGFSRDISERKRFENALMESEEKFRELAENTNDSFILRSGKKIVYVNPAFEQVYGYTKEELHYDPELYKKWIHPLDKERILSVLKSDPYKSTHVFSEQYRIIKGNGAMSWIWNRSYPVWNEKGEAYRTVSVASDITEIKELEDKLRKSQSQQQAILDNIPHLAWLKDKNGKYVSVNESFSRFFNLPKKEIIGKTDFDIVDDKLALDYIRKDKEVFEYKKPRLFFEIEEGRFGKRYSETHKTPVLNEEGEVIGITGISRDITDQKLSEQALQESEEKYKDLVTLLPEVVFETDEKGKITYVNLKGYEEMEFNQDDFEKGVNIFQLISEKDLQRAKNYFAELQHGKEIRGTEYQVVTKTGKEFPVMIFTNNMFREGKWIGIRGVMINITKRKKLEEQEKEHKLRLQFLNNTALEFLSMPSGVNIYEYTGAKLYEFIPDSEILVSSYNDERKSLVMEYFSAMQKQPEFEELFKQHVPDKEIPIDEENITDLRNNAEHLIKFEDGFVGASFGKIPRATSKEIEKQIQLKDIYGIALLRSGKLYGSILIINKKGDIHDVDLIETFVYQSSIALHRRQLENELRESKVRAEQSDKLKTAFLANMSHEIRTPMNGILGITQILEKTNVNSKESKSYLQMINANGKMLLNLVNDIIDLSKIESNQVDLQEQEFSLHDLMSDLECFFKAEQMVKSKSDVKLIRDEHFKPEDSHIIGDHNKIKQILINLIGNAIKFTEKGSIEFGYVPDKDNMLRFYVKDSGVGIQEDKISHIFERFTQADQSLSRPFGGSGLGLAICKGFTERMGGEIWAESTPGKGSEFSFTIPFRGVRKKNRKVPEKKTNRNEFNWEDICILIVEDNYVSFRLLEVTLRKTGVKIIHADDGKKAVDAVQENPEIDIVLMDIQLPVMNGFEATKEIKKLKPDLPVIAQTANAMGEDKLDCLNAGCSDYVSKPIVLESLMDIIDNYLKKD